MSIHADQSDIGALCPDYDHDLLAVVLTECQHASRQQSYWFEENTSDYQDLAIVHLWTGTTLLLGDRPSFSKSVVALM